MTLPSAAAITGVPSSASISMPLVLLLKLWMIFPRNGQPQSIVSASAACAGLVTPTGVDVATVDAFSGLSLVGDSVSADSPEASVVTFNTWPTFSSPGSTMPFSFDSDATFISLLLAMLYKVSPRLTTYVPSGAALVE